MRDECQFDGTLPIEARVSWVENRIHEGDCQHVSKTEIWRGESHAYAVLGARCYSLAEGFRCEKASNDEVHWFAVRRFSRKNLALKGKIVTYATPNNQVRVSRTDGEEGPVEFVLPPCSSHDPALASDEGKFSVLFTPVEEAKNASIDLAFEVWLDQPKKPSSSNLGLVIVVPPKSWSVHSFPPQKTVQLGAAATGKEPRKMNEMQAALVAEGVKVLAEHGFAFFKKMLERQADELIQLNIANLPAPVAISDKPVEDIKAALVKDTHVKLSEASEEQLKGSVGELRKQVRHLNNLKKNRWEAKGVVDQTTADDSIEETEANIENLKKQIWNTLQEVGFSASLTPKPM